MVWMADAETEADKTAKRLRNRIFSIFLSPIYFFLKYSLYIYTRISNQFLIA